MIQGIYSSTAGMINQQIMLEVITNNLANVNTSGYKRDEISFSGMLNVLSTSKSRFPVSASANAVNPEFAGLDTVSAKFTTDFAQGSIRRTDNPLDLALDGSGFFVIQHANGTRYTRSGNFSLDSTGRLVTVDGYPVMGINGVVQIQGDQVEIDSAGQVITDGMPVAKLKLVDFQGTNGLVKAGNNTFMIANAILAEEMHATAQVKQGFLELSNVNAVYEMAKMIEAMRVYESYQKTIQLISETLEKASDELGKISV